MANPLQAFPRKPHTATNKHGICKERGQPLQAFLRNPQRNQQSQSATPVVSSHSPVSEFAHNPPPPRVLVTRAPEQGSELADHLRALGADPVLIPAIELAPPTTWATLDAALEQLGSYDWLLFTSANAAEAFASRRTRVPHLRTASPSLGGSPPPISQDSPNPNAATPRVPHLRTASPSLGGSPPPTSQDKQPQKIAAIGPATAKALQKHGLTPDLLPPQAVAESLTEALFPHTHQPDGIRTKFLLIRAEEARELLPETLRAAGAEVTVAPAYRTVIPESSIHRIRQLFAPAAEPPAAITFTSSSTARNLLALCDAAGVTLPEAALRISIGPITTQTLDELGLPPHAEAKQATVAALAEATVAALAKAGEIHRVAD